jgi:hypothetical protein
MNQPTQVALSVKRPKLISVVTLGTAWLATVQGILQGDGKGTFAQIAESWRLGDFVPGTNEGDGTQALQIANMLQCEDGSVDVFARPVGQNPLQDKRVGIVIKLLPTVIKVITTAAQLPLWERMQEEQGSEVVASLVSQWLDLPIDLVLEHLEEMTQEANEGEAEAAAAEAAQVPELANGSPVEAP